MIKIIDDRAGKTVSFRPILSTLPARFALLMALLTLFMAVLPPPLKAGENNNPSGYPLPRFASLRSEPINVRKGPGVRYEVAWVFVKAGLPVEIIQEFDVWRKIRDSDGQEGWIQQSLLSGRRSGYIAPWDPNAKVAVRAGTSENAAVRAWLSTNYPVKIENCNGTVCKVSLSNTSGTGRQKYSGFVTQAKIWGVYPNEIFK